MIELLQVSDEIIAGVQFFYCRPVTRELHVSKFVRYTKSATELVVIHKSFPYSRKELVSHANLANLTKRLSRPKGPKAISRWRVASPALVGSAECIFPGWYIRAIAMYVS